MLDSCILGTTINSSYGSGALKALQNDHIPDVDLLVREAIQNSSDASLNEPENFFCVNFNYSEFSPSKLNRVLKDIGVILDEKYPSATADYLEIRDLKTSGLTGKTKVGEIDPNDHGNFFKLVFDTGKEQTNSDGGKAGGSWGYGKSVYFRVGIGLVVFYSHIKIDTGYESRLIVALVEREGSQDALLTKIRKDSIGRAWWGMKYGNRDDEIGPLTDEKEISEILDIFGIAPFGEDETGTSIIIPYIDKRRLMEGIFPENCDISDDVIAMCSFKDDIVEYTKLAAQKWYAPKLDNKNLKAYSDQKRLVVRVNGDPLRIQDMRLLFLLIQELYTAALSANKYGRQDYYSAKFGDIKCVQIPSNKIEGGQAGYAASVVVSSSKLSNTGTIIPPKAYLRMFNTLTNNDPIVMFARAAGVVLDYKVDGDWTKGLVKPEGDDSFLFVFFVPNCALQVKRVYWDSGLAKNDFGEYLRRCEKSDHMDWNDESKQTIITNIKNQLVKKINNCYKKQDVSSLSGAASRLSSKLGHRLLPKLGYGKRRGAGSGGAGGGGGKSSNFILEFSPSTFDGNSVSMDFKMTFKNELKSTLIGLFVESEVGFVDAKTWASDIGTAFPIAVPLICNCKTYSVDLGKTEKIEASCGPDNRQIQNSYTQLELLYTKEGSAFGIRVKNEITNAIVTGRLVLTSSDKKYCFTLKEMKSDKILEEFNK
jgi:hypothetical protein